MKILVVGGGGREHALAWKLAQSPEVDEVLANSTEDRHSREGSRMALGQTSSGRHLKVIYVRDSRDSSLFVITAYQITGKALAAYRRRRRQRSQK